VPFPSIWVTQCIFICSACGDCLCPVRSLHFYIKTFLIQLAHTPIGTYITEVLSTKRGTGIFGILSSAYFWPVFRPRDVCIMYARISLCRTPVVKWDRGYLGAFWWCLIFFSSTLINWDNGAFVTILFWKILIVQYSLIYLCKSSWHIWVSDGSNIDTYNIVWR